MKTKPEQDMEVEEETTFHPTPEEVQAMRLESLAAAGYERDDEKVWWSKDREHCLWVERVDRKVMLCVGDSDGLAVAYIPPKVARVIAASPRSFL
jgi:hypothetical protein